METMSYTSSTNFNLSFSNSTGTAKPGAPFYLWKEFSYESQGPALYRLNMPLIDQYTIITPVPFDYLRQEGDEFYICLNDALRRYQELNNGASFDISTIDKFIQVLKNICINMQLKPYIIFNKFAAKIQLTLNNKDYVVDYDYDDPDVVFILSPKDGTIFVKECILEKLDEILRSF